VFVMHACMNQDGGTLRQALKQDHDGFHVLPGHLSPDGSKTVVTVHLDGPSEIKWLCMAHETPPDFIHSMLIGCSRWKVR